MLRESCRENITNLRIIVQHEWKIKFFRINLQEMKWGKKGKKEKLNYFQAGKKIFNNNWYKFQESVDLKS